MRRRHSRPKAVRARRPDRRSSGWDEALSERPRHVHDVTLGVRVQAAVPGQPAVRVLHVLLGRPVEGAARARGDEDVTLSIGRRVVEETVAPDIFAYQWRRQGADGIFRDVLDDGDGIRGATTDTLTITGIVPADEGRYVCVVTNDCGEDTLSESATLSLLPAQICTQPTTETTTQGGTATFDASDVSDGLFGCLVQGTLTSGGQTFRCPGLTGSTLGLGIHSLCVTLDLSDATSVDQCVTLEVLANTEP